MKTKAEPIDRYFSEYFDVDPKALEDYGALDVSVITDLPLFIDPFLLFTSDRPEYQELHEDILKYLRFLKSKSVAKLDSGLIDSWYRFAEVKQNWLGYTLLGNGGRGLGREFAEALYDTLATILSNFGEEDGTGTHLEKLTLIKDGVGKDSISDFTTNLIKEYLVLYTQKFAQENIAPAKRRKFVVPRVKFDYRTETWMRKRYDLPALDGDFVLLTPIDMLTLDEVWINHKGMIKSYDSIPPALPDKQLRAQVGNYFSRQLTRRPTKRERDDAAKRTFSEFPELIDEYIRQREEQWHDAAPSSARKVDDAKEVLVSQPKRAVEDLRNRTNFYDLPYDTYEEALSRVQAFKYYIEHQDGYRLINRKGGAFSKESEVQVYFGLLWTNSRFDVNREPNNGRGPVDFKISYGAGDKSLIEFKLGSNSSLKNNLEKQVEIYKMANKTDKAIKVIVCYSETQQMRVAKILAELNLLNEPSVVVIDARNDNKPSASTA
ncbi:hypothetical protein [Nocardia aurea]|uniref:Uncharacterized protein n=1 Tax=Nocardia aurea TaxID=2144174 RepID=A0ABV3FV06_9NOCA